MMYAGHSASTTDAITVCDLRRQLWVFDCDWLQPTEAPPCGHAKRQLRRSILMVPVPHGLCLFQAGTTVSPTADRPKAMHSRISLSLSTS